MTKIDRKDKESEVFRKKMFPLLIGLTMVSVLSAACGTGQPTPIPTQFHLLLHLFLPRPLRPR